MLRPLDFTFFTPPEPFIRRHHYAQLKKQKRHARHEWVIVLRCLLTYVSPFPKSASRITNETCSIAATSFNDICLRIVAGVRDRVTATFPHHNDLSGSGIRAAAIFLQQNYLHPSDFSAQSTFAGQLFHRKNSHSHLTATNFPVVT